MMNPAPNDPPKRSKSAAGPILQSLHLIPKDRNLLEAAHDFAQRALTLFPFGCARVETSDLPGGGYAMVGIWNNRYVRSAATLRGRAQSSQHQGLKLRSCLRRLVRHGLLLCTR